MLTSWRWRSTKLLWVTRPKNKLLSFNKRPPATHPIPILRLNSESSTKSFYSESQFWKFEDWRHSKIIDRNFFLFHLQGFIQAFLLTFLNNYLWFGIRKLLLHGWSYSWNTMSISSTFVIGHPNTEDDLLLPSIQNTTTKNLASFNAGSIINKGLFEIWIQKLNRKWKFL